MATSVKMKHKQSGIIKNGYYGFSWTSFFFGGIPALLRGDIAYGLGVLVAGLLFGALTLGILWFVIGLIWAFIYNKNYTHRLIQSGYDFDDTAGHVADAKSVLGIGAALEKNVRASSEKKCPYCAEIIKAEAIVCRFCGRDVDGQVALEEQHIVLRDETNEKKQLINDKKKTLDFSTPDSCLSSLKKLEACAETIGYNDIELERAEIKSLADKLDKESRTFKDITYDTIGSMQEAMLSAKARDKKTKLTFAIVIAATLIFMALLGLLDKKWP